MRRPLGATLAAERLTEDADVNDDEDDDDDDDDDNDDADVDAAKDRACAESISAGVILPS